MKVGKLARRHSLQGRDDFVVVSRIGKRLVQFQQLPQHSLSRLPSAEGLQVSLQQAQRRIHSKAAVGFEEDGSLRVDITLHLISSVVDHAVPAAGRGGRVRNHQQASFQVQSEADGGRGVSLDPLLKGKVRAFPISADFNQQLRSERGIGRQQHVSQSSVRARRLGAFAAFVWRRGPGVGSSRHVGGRRRSES